MDKHRITVRDSQDGPDVKDRYTAVTADMCDSYKEAGDGGIQVDQLDDALVVPPLPLPQQPRHRDEQRHTRALQSSRERPGEG